ncbi:MAG: helix-turn-helix domain-containing protein [Eubacteriales bacterium]|nr:helix-turn-helix domain-containing protein [Eubacteriales bacterium]MDD4106001.1 helix-turn-helix domain-containing protein [Eubacteriales bacterium]MDD4711624.1 helix-turn-helix domain-containing protein [Eubacteriales bacterium]
MDNPTVARRLQQAMDEKGYRQVDVLQAVKPYCTKYDIKISKGQLSQYLSGRNEPSQKRLFVLAKALDVSEGWLMGLDVPKERSVTPALEQKKELAATFDKLSEEQQKFFIQAMKGIVSDREP